MLQRIMIHLLHVRWVSTLLATWWKTVSNTRRLIGMLNSNLSNVTFLICCKLFCSGGIVCRSVHVLDLTFGKRSALVNNFMKLSKINPCLLFMTIVFYFEVTSCNPVLHTEIVWPPPSQWIGDWQSTCTVKCWLSILSMWTVNPPSQDWHRWSPLHTKRWSPFHVDCKILFIDSSQDWHRWSPLHAKRQMPFHVGCKMLIVDPPGPDRHKTALAFGSRFWHRAKR